MTAADRIAAGLDPAPWTVVYTPAWDGPEAARPDRRRPVTHRAASAAQMRYRLQEDGVPTGQWAGRYSGTWTGPHGDAWTFGPSSAVCTCATDYRDPPRACLVHPDAKAGALTGPPAASDRLYLEVTDAAPGPAGLASALARADLAAAGARSRPSRGESAEALEARAARPRVRLAERKHPWYAELASARPVVWTGRRIGGTARPCLDVITDDGRRVFVRFGRDGTRHTDGAAMRELAAFLIDQADRLDEAAGGPR